MKYASVFYQIAVIFFKIIHKLVVDKQINVKNEYIITYCIVKNIENKFWKNETIYFFNFAPLCCFWH